MNPFQMMNQFKQNPMAMLSKRFNIPQNMNNDPNQIIQYLMNTGQISQSQYNMANQQLKQLKKQNNMM